MNTLQLEKMGLAPMTETEMQKVDGGVMNPIVWGVVTSLLGVVADGFITGFVNTSSVKKGEDLWGY